MAMGIDGSILVDLQVEAFGGVSAALTAFARHPELAIGAGNSQTQANSHTHSRALAEAMDLNEWMQNSDVSDRLAFRTASYCMERSGHFDAHDQVGLLV